MQLIEFQKDIRPSTTKLLLGILQTILFVVFIFSKPLRVIDSLLVANFLVLIPSLYFMFINTKKFDELVSPLLYKRALLIQLCMHLCIFTFWGFFSSAVAKHFPLIIHQIAYVYLFYFVCCMLFNRPFVMSLSLIPMIFSINLFMWFYNDYFLFQYVLISLAILAKMFLTREVNGKRSHIFNPSAIVLMVVTVVVLALPNKDLVYGPQIGSMWLGLPHFDAFIFLLACITLWTPNRYLISIGAVGLIILGDWYAETYLGMRLFAELARGSVLLGCTLLITDPATSPENKYGQLLFGIAYGLSISIAFTIFSAMGWNTYYDKLFFVCLLNFFSPQFEKWGQSIQEKLAQFKSLSFLSIVESRKFLLIVYFVFIWNCYARLEKPTQAPFLMSLNSLMELPSFNPKKPPYQNPCQAMK